MEEAFELGIDVSKWQGDIDWGKVKASGIKFAIAKATEGRDIQDEKFLQNWQGMKNIGIEPAAYHYFLGNDSASFQILNIHSVLENCSFDKNNDILAIDVEYTKNENIPKAILAYKLNYFLEMLKDFKHIYIYCSPWYWQHKITFQLYDFSVYKLWIADWSGYDQPRIPNTWSTKGYTWWQYSGKGKVDGINEFFVGLNRRRKSVD